MTSSNLPDFTHEIRDINNSRSTVQLMVNKDLGTVLTHRTEPYRSLPRTFRVALERVADYVRVTMIPETFSQEGPGWPSLRPRTVRERMQQGYPGHHPILRRSGDLFKELTEKSHPNHIEIIRVGKNARVEIGGSSEKFIRNQMGFRQSRLPARPMIPGTGYVPVADRHRKEMTRIMERAVKERMK